MRVSLKWLRSLVDLPESVSSAEIAAALTRMGLQVERIEVIGDVELAWRLDRAGRFGSPRTWLAVTGTNGKTTTTGMLAEIMHGCAGHGPASGASREYRPVRL